MHEGFRQDYADDYGHGISSAPGFGHGAGGIDESPEAILGDCKPPRRYVLTIIVVLLQVYFITMNMTVERLYCHEELKAGDTRFLIPETVDFCKANNPLFLARPEWLRVATCCSAYGLVWGYALVLYAAVANSWHRLRIPLLLFVGAKMNAIVFYHIMEVPSMTRLRFDVLFFMPPFHCLCTPQFLTSRTSSVVHEQSPPAASGAIFCSGRALYTEHASSYLCNQEFPSCW